MTWTTLPNGDKTITLNSGSSITLPSDWSSSANTAECYASGCNASRTETSPNLGGNGIGNGAGGGGFNTGTLAAVGGGGGAYASEINVGAADQTVNYQIGVPGAGTTPDTWFIDTSTVKADGTSNHIGGSAANSVGSVKYSGGNASITGKGAGGAAGPNGAGGNADSAGNGGAGNGGLAGDGGDCNTPNETGRATGGAIVLTYTPV